MARRIIEMEVAASKPIDGAADLVVEMIAQRLHVTEDGSIQILQDSGLPMWSDYITEKPLTVREYIADIKRDRGTLFQADAPRGSITATSPTPSSTSPVVEIPAGNTKPTVTKLMRLAKDNPALREKLIANPNGIKTSSTPSMTAMMAAAKTGDTSAYNNLISGLPSNR
ncbi:hypothetical protein EU555_35385 [Methylobacterium nonmethylotrophicum]|uniref:Uncharacterized protein n=2 Tax=Methylobacterium nonmethylotrophicum TaxID=1141884 RepID=A0A4Z0NDZ4_9HYPH|nr:hypothetical protein EU555_35385 [Methylobacterium nonmethylotrophicum]